MNGINFADEMYETVWQQGQRIAFLNLFQSLEAGRMFTSEALAQILLIRRQNVTAKRPVRFRASPVELPFLGQTSSRLGVSDTDVSELTVMP